MIESIKEIILSGGIVKYSYKTKIDEWMSDIAIFIIEGKVFLQGPFFKNRFDTEELDEAVKAFGRVAFHRDNIAIAHHGIFKHNLCDDIESVSDQCLGVLIEEYNNKFYDQDFPFFKEFM